MPRNYLDRLIFLLRKKRAGLITVPESEELIELLNIARKDADLTSGERVAAGLVLATSTGKQKPRELMP